MSHGITIEGLLGQAVEAHRSASQLLRPTWFLPSRLERRFAAAIDRFIEAVRSVPQAEVQRMTAEQRQRVS